MERVNVGNSETETEQDISNGTSVVARLTDELRREILAGVLKPGQRIRQEEIGRRAGVSRVPAREALRALSGEGLVTLIPNVGARVARLEPAELIEIYLIRERLEPAAIVESIPHLSPQQIDTLKEMHATMERLVSPEDPIELGHFLEVDRDFHILMATAGPMKRLHAIVREMINAAQPYRRAVSVTDPQRVIRRTNDEHRLILDAVCHGDADEAGVLLGLHIQRTRRALTSSVPSEVPLAQPGE